MTGKKKPMRRNDRTERIAQLQRNIARSRRRLDRRVTTVKARTSLFTGCLMFPRMNLSSAMIGGVAVMLGWLIGRKSERSFLEIVSEVATSPTPWQTLWVIWDKKSEATADTNDEGSPGTRKGGA